MCPRDPKATPNIRLSDDYNITSVVKFLSKFWYFSQVSVKADFHPTITIRSLEFAFVQSITVYNQAGIRRYQCSHYIRWHAQLLYSVAQVHIFCSARMARHLFLKGAVSEEDVESEDHYYGQPLR